MSTSEVRKMIINNNKSNFCLRPRLHEQIKHALFAQIRPGLLHTDREFEQLKEVLFAHVNAALLFTEALTFKLPTNSLNSPRLSTGRCQLLSRV